MHMERNWTRISMIIVNSKVRNFIKSSKRCVAFLMCCGLLLQNGISNVDAIGKSSVGLPIAMKLQPQLLEISTEETTQVNQDVSENSSMDASTVEDHQTTTAEITTAQPLKLGKPSPKVSKKTSSSITLSWKKVKNAEKYYIYRGKKKSGTYKKIGKTSKLKYVDKYLVANTTYYYKVVAVGVYAEDKTVLSKKSNAVKAKTKKIVYSTKLDNVKTAYVGDSIMYGMGAYNMVKGKNRKVIAEVGITPDNYWKSSITDDLLDYEPARIYIMLGMNSLVGTPSDQQMDAAIKYIKQLIVACQTQREGARVIILPVSPVAPGAPVKNQYINKFNKKLKTMAKNKKVRYYDYTADFKDASGNMKSAYSASDGIHWTASAYKLFKAKLDAYEKTLR